MVGKFLSAVLWIIGLALTLIGGFLLFAFLIFALLPGLMLGLGLLIIIFAEDSSITIHPCNKSETE